MSRKPNQISINFALNDVQKTLVVQHLWLALSETFATMHELIGPEAPFDLKQRLMLGVKNSDTAGLPLHQEKPAIDAVLHLLDALVTLEPDNKSSHGHSE